MIFLVLKIFICMLNFFLYLSIVIISILLMEFVAIFSHKYIMHGPGWIFHKSHHINKNKHKFELNDYYFLFFSSPSILCFVFGFIKWNPILISIGFGILCYGLIYILLHDLMVHKRFGFKLKFTNSYLAKVKKSHLKHHACRNKDGATNFGFIIYR